MSIIVDCSNSLNYIQTLSNNTFTRALRESIINASNLNYCRPTPHITDITSITCPQIQNNGRPYFNECKKNKIFYNKNQNNSAITLTKKQQYLMFAKGFQRNGLSFTSRTIGRENFLFTNSNVPNYRSFNSNNNILNICQQ